MMFFNFVFWADYCPDFCGNWVTSWFEMFFLIFYDEITTSYFWQHKLHIHQNSPCNDAPKVRIVTTNKYCHFNKNQLPLWRCRWLASLQRAKLAVSTKTNPTLWRARGLGTLQRANLALPTIRLEAESSLSNKTSKDKTRVRSGASGANV